MQRQNGARDIAMRGGKRGRKPYRYIGREEAESFHISKNFPLYLVTQDDRENQVCSLQKSPPFTGHNLEDAVDLAERLETMKTTLPSHKLDHLHLKSENQ